jgi:serine O-acetyltransferase
MEAYFLKKLYEEQKACKHIPSPEGICQWIEGVLAFLFPQLANQKFHNYMEFEVFAKKIELDLHLLLHDLLDGNLHQVTDLQNEIIAKLPDLKEQIQKDAEAIDQGDPASSNVTEVIRTYPGFYAIAIYRISHLFHSLNIPLIPRILSEHAHTKTGIEIHPAAQIGPHFCIDHGTGVVIGETVVIGQHVKIYQGVTLGAISVKKEMAKTKRHPTIEDHVVIYSGTTILGGSTVIGHHSIIGGNVWLTESVPPHSTVYYKSTENILS